MNNTQLPISGHHYSPSARFLLTLLVIAPLCASLFIYCPVPYQRTIPAYKNWERVNPAPHRVPGVVAAACAPMPTPGNTTQPSIHSDDMVDKFSVAYINPIGRDAMFSARPRFPSGSIIAKEKLSDSLSGSTELVAMMIKQQPGYDPEGGDWEYRVSESYSMRTIESGPLEHCRNCHAYRRDMDFVYRTYLPPERIE